MSVVPTSQSAIVRSSGERLEAMLGSCVGVTLCDRQTGVGGLIHLLLPEPATAESDWLPESYATTALPRFIAAVVEAGAKKNQLEACVAGGALMAPLSTMDVELDIGGRTAEVAGRILERENIPVVRSETGGYFSWRLTLDPQTWETTIEPILPLEEAALPPPAMPEPEVIDRAILRTRPVPQIALKILRMIEDDNYRLDQVAQQVRQEQVISARLITLCNSPMLGLSRSVDSIDRALVLLGEKKLLQMVLSASMEVFLTSHGGYSLCRGGLFQHSLGAALAAEELARLTGAVPPETAYTAGLLHDIGKTALDQFIGPRYPFFYRLTRERGLSLVDVERKVLGVDHAVVGGRLARVWGLPENLVDTITHHHQPEQAAVNPSLASLTYLTDVIISSFQVGLELGNAHGGQLMDSLKVLGIEAGSFQAVIERIWGRVFNPGSA